MTFHVDNPGGNWLAEKQKWATKDKNSNMLSGATTGYFDNRLKLPTEMVSSIPGALGEHKFRDSSPKLERLEKEIGNPKKFNTKKHPISIHINHIGQPYIYEGNHRVAYAKKYGIPHVHAEVYYVNGGEAQHSDTAKPHHIGGFSPNKISQYEVAMIRMEKLIAMYKAEIAVDKALANLSEAEKKIYETAAKKDKYTVHEEDGYVKVKHPVHGTVCAGNKDRDGRINNIEFTDDKFKHNAIRQPAMVALQKFEKKQKDK